MQMILQGLCIGTAAVPSEDMVRVLYTRCTLSHLSSGRKERMCGTLKEESALAKAQSANFSPKKPSGGRTSVALAVKE